MSTPASPYDGVLPNPMRVCIRVKSDTGEYISEAHPYSYEIRTDIGSDDWLERGESWLECVLIPIRNP
jgi:hypothetical protein